MLGRQPEGPAPDVNFRSSRGQRPGARGRALGAMDARALRAVLLFRVPGADLSTHLAAGTISHLRRQHRVGDHRGHRVHAGLGDREPRRWLAVESQPHCAVAAARRHRGRDRGLRPRFARHIRSGRRLGARPVAAADRHRHLGARDRADLADGRDVAGAGRASRSPLGSGRKCGRVALLRQHARRRRRLPRLHGATVPVPRHARGDLRRGRDQRRSGGGRARDAMARARPGILRRARCAGHHHADARARLGAGAGTRRRRRVRLLVVRDLLLSYRVLRVRFERDRLRLDAERVPGRSRLGIASGRRQLPAFFARRGDAPGSGRPAEGQPARPCVPAAAQPRRLARSRRDRRRHADGLSGGALSGARCCPIWPSLASRPTPRPGCARRTFTSPISWAPPPARSSPVSC